MDINAVKKKRVRRPMNAFLIFCKRHRSKERERHPELDNRSITRILGDKWAKLEPEKKAVYINLAKEQKEAFMKANPNYKWHSADKSQGSAKSASSGAPASSSALKKPSQKVSADAPPSNAKSSGKGSLPPTSDASKLLTGDSEASPEHNSALLQLAEMCTSELYSSAPLPEKTTAPTSQTRLSSPLPPPKKRARQWSLDNSDGPPNAEPQKSDSQSKKSLSKSASGNRRTEASSGNKRSKGTSKNTHAAIQPPGKSGSTPSFKLDDEKQNDPQSSLSPPSQHISEALPFPPLGQIQTSDTFGASQVHSIELRGDGKDLPQQHPPQQFSTPGSSTPFFYRETLGSAPEFAAHKAHRDLPEQFFNFIHHSAKQAGDMKPESLFERKHSSVGLPLPTEGKIASLLSSSSPLAGFEAGLVKVDNIDRKTPSVDGFTPPPQPLMNEKFGVADLKPLPGSLGTDTSISSGVSHSFTEGKVKKKWTQRMMVEAKKEEDQARQTTCGADRIWPSSQGPAHSSVPTSLKTSDFQSPPTEFSSDKNPFLMGKSEIKLEPCPVFSDGLSFKTSLPKDYAYQSLNPSNSLPPATKSVKSEALQSNTLYRALMGQTPSPFALSSSYNNAKTSMTTTPPPPPPMNHFGSSTFGAVPTKFEEDKKIFTPIAACGKKIMDHIVERLFQTGFSGEGKNSGPGQNILAEQTPPPHFPDDSSVCLKPPPPVKCSVVDLQTAFSFPVRSAQNLVEKIVTEMCQESNYNPDKDEVKSIKKEVDAYACVGQEDRKRSVKGQEIGQSSEVKSEGKDKSLDGLCANEQSGMTSELAEDSNLADFLDDSLLPPVRKSRRANRGQKYQALIKEGIIQPSKERLAARNAERNVRSCSSRDDLEKSESKKILKRSYSEKEPPQASVINDIQVPKAEETPAADPSKEFNLEKEIASLPACSYDQFEKKKTQQHRKHSESSLKKSDSKGGQTQLSKASGSSTSLQKETSVKIGCGPPASYHAASLKELGCHTVHIPLIKEERPPESLTGSRKRKARRHCITRISVAPLHGDVKENVEKPSLPKYVCTANLSDRIERSDATNCHKTGESGKTESQNTVFSHSKAQTEGGDNSAPMVTTPFSSQFNDGHTGKPSQLAQHNFPALTLLSSVMIDSEKAISPACQSRAPPTTQSPTPASLAKPWPLNGVDTAPHFAAKSSSAQLAQASHVIFSPASRSSDTTQLTKWMAAFPSCLQMPSSTFEKASSSLLPPAPVSSTATNTKPLPHAWPISSAIAAPCLSSATSAMSPMKHPHALPSTAMTGPVQGGSSTPMANPVHGSQGGSNAMQRPANSSVLSPYVISTLTASKTSESSSCPFPKPTHVEKQAGQRRKKSPKSTADERQKANSDLLSSVGPKSLEQGTKKLVKLLLKGDGDDEATLRSGMDTNGQTAPKETKPDVARPAHRPQDQQVTTPRSRPTSKTPKGSQKKGATPPNVQQQRNCNSPQYLSLKTQLKAGQMLASNQFSDPSAKKHKPTIWDHLNSPGGCLPIKNNTKSPQNTAAPPLKTRVQQPTFPPQSSIPGGFVPKGQRAAAGTKSSNRDSVGSDTESASEDMEEHASSDTDSAEESEIGSPCPTAVKTNTNSTTTIRSSCANVSIPTASCNPHNMSFNMSTPTSNEGGPGKSTPNSPVILSSSQNPSLVNRCGLPPPSPRLQPGVCVSSSQAANSNVYEAKPPSMQMRNLCLPKSSPDLQRSFPPPAQVILTTPSPLLSTRPSDTTVAAPLPQLSDVSSAAPSLSSQPLSCYSSSPVVYLPVIVTATDSSHAIKDAPKTVFSTMRPVAADAHHHPAPPSRIPIMTAYPSTSPSVDPGICDPRAPASSLLDSGGPPHVSTAAHLPGSPSVAVVQS